MYKWLGYIYILCLYHAPIAIIYAHFQNRNFILHHLHAARTHMRIYRFRFRPIWLVSINGPPGTSIYTLTYNSKREDHELFQDYIIVQSAGP